MYCKKKYAEGLKRCLEGAESSAIIIEIEFEAICGDRSINRSLYC
jgi:hypothetical protein